MKRQRNFDSLKRLVRGWLCRHGRHRWSYFTKQTKTLVFYERSCQWCGLFEINSAGPTGDKKWHKPESCFNGPCGDWEREQYNTANMVIYCKPFFADSREFPS